MLKINNIVHFLEIPIKTDPLFKVVDLAIDFLARFIVQIKVDFDLYPQKHFRSSQTDSNNLLNYRSTSFFKEFQL